MTLGTGMEGAVKPALLLLVSNQTRDLRKPVIPQIPLGRGATIVLAPLEALVPCLPAKPLEEGQWQHWLS